MPIYEYRCDDCNHVFEFLTLSGNSKEDVTCAKCDGDKVSKLISAGTIRSGSESSLSSSPPMGCGGNGCGGNSGFS